MKQILFLFVLFVAVVAATPIMAQEAEPEVIDELQTAEEVEKADGERVFKDQIVVTAARQEQASGDALAPITVFDREAIEMIQPEKMADLFKAIPGVEIDGEGPFRGLPVIRGLSSNRVLILVDGQRLNNARESTTFAGIQPALVNLAEVERIEVLRGPASVQYGSDAIGGVINIITRQPNLGAQGFKVSGDVAVEYGTASDSQQGRVSITGTGSGFSFYAGGRPRRLTITRPPTGPRTTRVMKTMSATTIPCRTAAWNRPISTAASSSSPGSRACFASTPRS